MIRPRHLRTGPELFQPERANSKGFDLTHTPTLDRDRGRPRALCQRTHGQAAPLLAGKAKPNKADTGDQPRRPGGSARHRAPRASTADIETALASAKPWDAPATERGKVLHKAADLYEENFGELFALLAREAGKTLPDAVAELREAVDFLRYYAANAPDDAARRHLHLHLARGTSRWRFSPARSAPHWPRAMPCWPNRPSRRR